MAAYTEALGDEICNITAGSSLGLRRICQQLRQPYSTVNDWIYKNLHGFADNYARAKQLQQDRIADDILEIADDDSNDRPQDAIARARLRIDVRKWLSAKLAAEESGNKQEATKKSRVNFIIESSPSPIPPENTPGTEPQCDQPGATPAKQSQTPLSPDAILKDKSAHEGQENIEEPHRSSLRFIHTHLPVSSPKTTLVSPAEATAREVEPAEAIAKEEPALGKRGEIAPRRPEYHPKGIAPALCRR